MSEPFEFADALFEDLKRDVQKELKEEKVTAAKKRLLEKGRQIEKTKLILKNLEIEYNALLLEIKDELKS